MNPSPIEALDLTRRLIAFDTVNPPGNERACALYLADILTAAGFAVQVHELAPERASLVAVRAADDRPPLVFTGHLDVVPLGHRAWNRDPFAGTLADGKIHGRGASDMKSGIAAFVCAAIDARTSPANLKLIITSGEETGCVGACALVAAGGLGSAGAIIVGEPTANEVCVGHKGALWLNAITSGIAAHGSMPERGDNAIYKAADVIARLESFAFGTPAHAALGSPTLSVNTVKGGININSVPDRAEIGVDIRTVPSVDHGELRRRLQALVADKARLEVFLDLPGIWSAPDLAWVQTATALACAATGSSKPPGTATYFTDASVLTPALGAPPTIILGPGEPAQAHQTDEWCSVERIGQAVTIYRRLIEHWATAGATRG